MKKPSKKEISEIMSYLGKQSKKLHPLTTEKSIEMNRKRWANKNKSSVDNSLANPTR